MKKITTIIASVIVILFSKTSAQCQDTIQYIPKGVVSVNVGVAQSMGNFRALGKAKDGMLFNISAQYPILKSNFSAAFKMDITNNNFDIDEALYSVHKQPQYAYTYYPSTSYWANSYMAGVCYTLASAKSCFDFRILSGLTKCKTPETLLSKQDDKGTIIYELTKQANTSNSLSLNIGTTARFDLSSKMFFALNIDMFFSELNYNAEHTTITTNSITNTTSTNLYYQKQKQDFRLMNISVGVGYKF